ncbi:disulfide bond formation protein DsbB [Pectobacterium wasabiae]|uniref:Disulfide bond formation protein B n=1 Tax=Pectobacterium wasabiae TaxID=55208 RepID=A0AAW3EKX1_9GAMM|nr:disulfide bond formation protein DsbB [Pectobacterium wasabiae]AOR65233.1 disulfide bond formation protein B [Pectobacterium wasabiae CFBP 3304]EJS95905.1 Disulfide bond formation protein [Pectobacterium wasabiae CFBP 3304]KFX09504.1 disulfide bond formation protein B [Pectobacterium wasabiae]KGA29706.1 disulfide bond formation protein B [Pectobacterium wasabiae]
MLRFLNRCSRGRGAWLLLAFTALALELTALYFQHVMLLKPCVLCIYQRSALWGVFAAGIVGAIAPSSLLRYPAIALWIYSSYEGVRLAWKHTDILLNPSPFNTCDFFVSFPSWLPLDKWLPAIFNATGDCSERQWSFLSMEMPQWLLGIFAAYLLIAVLVLIAQPFRPKRRDLFSR